MKDKRPNVLFIMSDDHASHAMSCYGSRINQTPNLDRISDDGIRFDNRTLRYKLIYYYSDALGQPGAIDETYEPEWELFDLDKDPYELNSVYSDPEYADTVKDLKDELHRLQAEVGDTRYERDRE